MIVFLKCAIKYYESSPCQGIGLQPVLPSLKASLFLALPISRLPWGLYLITCLGSPMFSILLISCLYFTCPSLILPAIEYTFYLVLIFSFHIWYLRVCIMNTRPVSYTHLDVYKRQVYARARMCDSALLFCVCRQIFLETSKL